MDGKEIIKAIDAIAEEKNISKDVILNALELALTSAYKKNFESKTNVRVDINSTTGDIKVFTYYKVVDEIIYPEEPVENEDGEIIEVEEPSINYDSQILLEDAQEIQKNVKLGDEIEVEVTPSDFGRVAAGTAKQVIMQKIREAEKESVIAEFDGKQDELMVGLLAMEDARNYYVDLGRTRGVLPKIEIIPGEELKMGTSIKVYIAKVETTAKGPFILLSRKHYGFVKRLFEREIPELENGTIELFSVAREPGVRSKVAVFSNDSQVDPVGTCIGAKGSRIGNILKELNGEKVDLILYNPDPVEFIKNALSPAKDVIVNITDEVERTALVIVNDDNLSLAIGKKGSNVKLASRLTKYRLDIKTLQQINEEGNK